jgi:Rrf2 family protein
MTMKLTNASTYAVTALAYLAREKPAGSVTAHVIAGAEGIPELFLLKLLTPLAQAGLVCSRKGPGGGYALAHKPKDITLLQIVEAVEGPLHGVAPPLGKEGAAIDKRLRAVCDAVAAHVRERLTAVTLAELATFP